MKNPFKKEHNIEHLRHTFAHLLAAAVKELYPKAKPTIGPAIEHGFYYDFDFGDAKISDEDLPKIEKKMRELLPEWKEFTGEEKTADEARAYFKKNPYKVELIDELEKEEQTITFYTAGGFTDLCRGGHAEHPAKELAKDAFKLTSVAGAYWRGDEKNTQLTRIYGIAFESKKELDAHLEQIEEAKKRDHRKIGKEMDLFFIDEMVGKGLIMWLPKGNVIKNEVEKFAVEKERAAGYVQVTTPHIAKEELYLTSGHLPYYKDDMYPAMEMDDGTYYLRAMNCPHHHRIYSHKPHSYRNLPLRIAEYGTVYRNELSGTLAGLLRVRGLAMNDAHIYCRKDQIEEEFKSVMQLTMEYFKVFELKEYWFRLSKWDPKRTDKYIDEPSNWEYAEDILRKVLKEMNVPFVEVEDEAAFYGPKVDVMFKSVIGREETMSTIQLDFLAKERFGLVYTDSDGNENNEVFVIHRAPLSTHERFLAFLIEHYAGNFPFWLAPVQVNVLPISEKHIEYAEKVRKQLADAGYRVELDDSDETVGKKIRNWKLSKTPYTLVIGDNEIEKDEVTLESRDDGKIGSLSLEKLLERFAEEKNPSGI